MSQPKNVYELAQERLAIIFKEFDTVCVSYSGGKDSGVMLNLCIDYIRQHHLDRKLCVFHMDYEIQYRQTIDYVDRTLASNRDILDVYRVCVPFRVSTCTSMYQSYWRPWQDDLKDIWVRPMPEDCYTKEDFPFYREDMWDYDFQMLFAKWLHARKDSVRTCFLIGIRTQESFNRWRSIHLSRKYQMYHKYRWTSKIGNDIYNAYPIYDWKTTDVWTANGKFHYDYNHLYDLYYKAGVSLERQRVASPFLCEAQDSLRLYRAIDPDTWGRMIGRVNGVNFTGIYGGTRAMGWQSVTLPKGYTWKEFMHFLLSTLPEDFQGDNLAADIHCSADGRYLYVSNRGHDSIAVFTIQKDGSLRRRGNCACGGKGPRSFTVLKDGWVLIANQASGNVVSCRIEDNGLLGDIRSQLPVPQASYVLCED